MKYDGDFGDHDTIVTISRRRTTIPTTAKQSRSVSASTRPSRRWVWY